jgi:hypothetical protein
MRTRFVGFGGVWMVTLLGLVMTFQLAAQKKPAKPAKMSNVQGTVENIDKGKMTIGVKNGNVRKPVMYSADTKFVMGHSKDNKPGSVDQVKTSNFISCSGMYETGKP